MSKNHHLLEGPGGFFIVTFEARSSSNAPDNAVGASVWNWPSWVGVAAGGAASAIAAELKERLC